MPEAAGQGATPREPAPAAAAGTGSGGYSATDAYRDIRQATTWDAVVASLNRIEPQPIWNSRGMQSHVPATLPRFTQQRSYVLYLLRTLSGARTGGRKTRGKRKHFRKRTSRRH